MNLRPLSKKDIPLMLEWMHDADIAAQFLRDMQGMREADVLEYIKASNENKNCADFAIVNDDDEYLGTVSLKNIDIKNKNAEYAISLRKKAMGTGAAQFATKSIVQYAFNELKLKKVYLNVLSENSRAIRFYEKFGFCYEGEFVNHVYIDNKQMNLKWYAIFSEDNK